MLLFVRLRCLYAIALKQLTQEPCTYVTGRFSKLIYWEADAAFDTIRWTFTFRNSTYHLVYQAPVSDVTF
jgi:hypothetical protein